MLTSHIAMLKKRVITHKDAASATLRLFQLLERHQQSFYGPPFTLDYVGQALTIYLQYNVYKQVYAHE